MSIGPVPGNGIAINVPQGKIVFWSVLAQAMYNQFVQLRDSKGSIVLTARGASAVGVAPTQIGQGIFQAADPTNSYTLWMGTNEGQQWSQVLWTQDALSIGSSVYSVKYIFSTEDADDQDYNDSYLQLQWFATVG